MFLQFEAPEYSQEGIDNFRASLDDKERTKAMKWYGAFDNGKLIGVLTMREPQHISGFFVRSDYQGKGFGRMLFEAMKTDYEKQEFTVNSSPYAVKIYEHLGFVPTDTEQTVTGIRFTPMIYKELSV
ncbi:MAG: GNAT family N-acetyltransferase [Acutalibacteraceae bacterium]